MNDKSYRSPRLLIPDNTPLSLLSNAGADGLNALFVPGVEVWVTDMVKIEATREPDPGDDARREQRRFIEDWFETNKHRVFVMETASGREYMKAMVNWTLGGSRPDLKPNWSDRGDASLINILSTAEKVVADHEAAVLIVDDRKARAALRTMENINLDIMSTEAFVWMLEEKFGVSNVSDIWRTIITSAGTNEHGKSKVPDRPLEDPVFVRKPT
jgi:hypothetical protein